MRILHVDGGREMRGGQWQVLRLHRGLLARGYQSFLLAPLKSPLLALCRRESLPAGILKPLRLSSLSRGFDLVHAHDARSHTLCALLSRTAFVVSRRVAFPVRRSAASVWKYGRAALFLAVSEYVKVQLEAAGIDGKRIEVVYDGVPLPPETAIGEEILIPETTDPDKGMALAEASAERAGVRVRRSANLPLDLPGARALVYLTRSEGLGSGVLLAMSYGVTVIASNVGGIPELIRDGENGILVANEIPAVVEAFGRIRPALGIAARATVAARFTERHMVDATIAACKRVLTGPHV